MSQRAEKEQLWIMLWVVMIGFLGSSVAYPLFPPLFLHPTSHSIVPSIWGEHARSIFLGIALAAYPLGQFIGSPVLGGYSDRYGRKRILVFGLMGGTLGYFLTGLALEFNWLWVLLLSRFVAGFMEGNFSIVRAMASELSGINKYKSLGRINAASAIGYIMGPLLGGFFSDAHILPWFSAGFPFFVATFFSGLAVLLAISKLDESKPLTIQTGISILQQFNLPKRFQLLFQNNAILKYWLLMSTIYTFAVDIFYEFGPVYLTGIGEMTPAGIAIYNTALSFSLALGSGWLPHKLSQYFVAKNITVTSMFITGLVFILMVLFPNPIIVFLLFAIAGLSIATVNTNTTVQISDVADKHVQGEAMGAQIGLRMLGDAVICLVGGFLIIASVNLPIIASSFFAFIAIGVYLAKLRK